MYGRRGKRSVKISLEPAIQFSPEKEDDDHSSSILYSEKDSPINRSFEPSTPTRPSSAVHPTVLEEDTDVFTLKEIIPIKPLAKKQKKPVNQDIRRSPRCQDNFNGSKKLDFEVKVKKENGLESMFKESKCKPGYPPSNSPAQLQEPRFPRGKPTINTEAIHSIFQATNTFTDKKTEVKNKIPNDDPWALLDAITKSPSKIKSSPISNARLTPKKLNLSRLSKSPSKYTSKKTISEIENGWDLLEQLSQSPTAKSNSKSPGKVKRKIDFNIDINYKSKEDTDNSLVYGIVNSEASHVDLFKLLNSNVARTDTESQNIINDVKQEHDQTHARETNFKSLLSSPSKNKLSKLTNTRTYGERRSYLQDHEVNHDNSTSQQQQSDLDQHSDDELNTLIKSPRAKLILEDHEEELKDLSKDILSISNLKAHGANTQYQDDLLFMLEGLLSSLSSQTSKCLDLIELAIRLIEDQGFTKFVKDHADIGKIWRSLDFEKDAIMCYVLGFILITLSEGNSNGFNLHDAENEGLIVLAEKLIDMGGNLSISKGANKLVEATLKKFQDRLGNTYSPRFFGVSLLFQSSLFTNDLLFHATTVMILDLDFTVSEEHKVLNMILIIYESFISDLELNELNSLKPLNEATEIFIKLLKMKSSAFNSSKQWKTTQILVSKILILLSLKQHPSVFTPDLVESIIFSIGRTIEFAETNSSELQTLHLGLLLNLLDSETCLSQTLASLQTLHSFYGSINKESLSFYALLIGTLYLKDENHLKEVLDITELQALKLDLVRFDCVGLSAVKCKVAEILQGFNV